MYTFFLILACTTDDSIDTQRAAKNILLDIPEIFLDESIVEEIEMIRQRSAIPAMGVVLAVKDRGIWARGFGLSDVEKQLSTSKDTSFMLASISKTFVATAILQLREEGLLDLQDSVHEQISFPLDNPHLTSEQIEVRHLVTHTSSIIDNWSVWGAPGGNGVLIHGDSPIALADFLEGYLVEGGNWYSAEDNWSENTPGTSYDYSNIGSALAGYLIEETTGLPLREHSKKNLFEPLGMNNTGWHLSDFEDVNSVALPYYLENEQPISYGHFGYPDYPDGQLRSSAQDLGIYMLMYLQDASVEKMKILSSQSIDVAFNPVLENIPNNGVFWGIGNDWGERVAWHSGSDFGVRTDLVLALDSEIGIAVLTNINDSSTNDAIYEIEDILYEASLLIE